MRTVRDPHASSLCFKPDLSVRDFPSQQPLLSEAEQGKIQDGSSTSSVQRQRACDLGSISCGGLCTI